VHQPQKEKPQTEKRAGMVKQRRTWTYVDENGQDLGQDYLKQNQEKNVSFFLLYYSQNYLSSLLL
jgi:hypothetical protein